MRVEKITDQYILKFFGLAGGLFVVVGVAVMFYSISLIPIFSAAYLISALFAGTNLLVIRKIGVDDNTYFYKIFGWSLALRFVGVLIAIIIALKVINIHEIFFTVSFIISYICHSIIEIIFINRILKTDTNH